MIWLHSEASWRMSLGFVITYIFELLEVNLGVAGFVIQLHPEDVDAVLESVTAHAEKGAGTKTTLYVG